VRRPLVSINIPVNTHGTPSSSAGHTRAGSNRRPPGLHARPRAVNVGHSDVGLEHDLDSKRQ
jgi:hypothetical protein